MRLGLTACIDAQVDAEIDEIIDQFSDEQKLEIARYCCDTLEDYDAKIIAENKKPKWKSYLVLLSDATYCIVFGQHKEDIITFLNYKDIKYVTYMPYVVPTAMKHIEENHKKHIPWKI